MSDAKRARAVDSFGRALAALEQALAEDAGDRRSRDSVILNFMLTYETAWKGFQAGWLRAEAPWLAMIQDRNLVAHTYNERTAEEVRRNVDAATAPLREALGVLTAHST